MGKNVIIGPWGCQKPQNQWTYEPNGSISHISITYDDAIFSISFTSEDEKGNVEHSKKFGHATGSKSAEVDIDIKNGEKLNYISGTSDLKSGYVVVTSLTFGTNTKRILGPFGTSRGTAFSFHVPDESFAGFHGRSGSWLDAIGVYLQPEKKVRLDQWGSQKPGNEWSYDPKGVISHISITHDDAIYSISFTSQDEKGNVDHSKVFGAKSGTHSDEIDIDIENEKLNYISGTFGIKSGYTVVTSLSFATDQNKVFGPFGTANGTAFSLHVSEQGFSGFHGRAGYWLDAIGVYLQPEKKMCLGQWGSQEPGNEWSYESKGAIAHISITHDDAIYSISFTSQDEKGNVDHSKVFGAKSGTHSDEIDIDIKNEKLNYISGTFGKKSGYTVVTSLSFGTDQNKVFGPFGTANGIAFSLRVSDQGFSGFYGRAGYWLDAIGVCLQPDKRVFVGRWGSKEPGNEWSYEPKGMISHISLTHDDAIYSISFTSQDEKDNVDHSKVFGAKRGTHSDEIDIDIKNERLNYISGTFGTKSGYIVVTSLSFGTDQKKVFGPFGTANGTAFSLLVRDQGFFGFHGRAGSWLDAIGVYLEE